MKCMILLAVFSLSTALRIEPSSSRGVAPTQQSPSQTAVQSAATSHEPARIETYDSCPHGVCHSFFAYLFGRSNEKPNDKGAADSAIENSQFGKRDDAPFIDVDTRSESPEAVKPEQEMVVPAAEAGKAQVFPAPLKPSKWHKERLGISSDPKRRAESRDKAWNARYAEYDRIYGSSA